MSVGVVLSEVSFAERLRLLENHIIQVIYNRYNMLKCSPTEIGDLYKRKGLKGFSAYVNSDVDKEWRESLWSLRRECALSPTDENLARLSEVSNQFYPKQ